MNRKKGEWSEKKERKRRKRERRGMGKEWREIKGKREKGNLKRKGEEGNEREKEGVYSDLPVSFRS